jgi:hypothetical protein
MSRNAVYDALLALGASINGASFGQIVESGRRLKMWDKAQKPALFQVEPDDNYKSHLGTLTKRSLKVTWVIYHNAGKDQSGTPASVTADILDAIDAILPSASGRYQTLGGLVYAAYIDGQIKKFEGDLDGQTIITVPITVLIP